MVKKFPLVLALLFAFAAPAWADFAAGEAAYARGDYKVAFREFKTEANRGNARAQYYLGNMYALGRGVTRNYTEAVRWYRKAAVQGIASAQYYLGLMYVKGQGVTRNYAEAAKWFRKAAEQGEARAQYTLGLMYALGQGVARNYVCAYMWVSLAAAQGNRKAAKSVDSVEKLMTSADVSRAQRLAAAWKPGGTACRPR